MAEQSFEYELERMFAVAPAMADSEFFALTVLERQGRGWTARRLLIGVMGAIGGLIGGVEVLSSGAIGEFSQLAGHANAFLVQHVSRVASDALAPVGINVDMQQVWMVGALALVAAGFGLARLVREI